jgi:hypothetical protein
MSHEFCLLGDVPVNLSNLDGSLWVAGFVCHCILFTILVLRLLYKPFPLFSAFVGFSALRTVILFCLYHLSLPTLYLNTYWCLAAVDTLLQFGLIEEVASKVFRRRGAWIRDIRGQLIRWTIVSVAVATYLAFLNKPSGHGLFQKAVLFADFFPAVLISELFVVMLVVSSDAGLDWRDHVASIAMGLAAFNFPAVVIETISDLHGFDANGNLDVRLQTARKLLYLACVLFWSYALWRPEPASRILSTRMEEQVLALRDGIIRKNGIWGDQ